MSASASPCTTRSSATRSRSTQPARSADDRVYTSQPVGSTGWRLLLVAPSSAIFQPVSGTNRWLPWVILIIGALALTAVGVLLRRALSASTQVRVANADLARSNADLERFAYVASHDLSEPLRTIGGFGGLLERRYADRLDDEGRMMLGHVTAGAARLQALIDGLLSYARVSTAPRTVEPIDLRRHPREVLDAIRPAINDRGANVDVGLLPTVEGERGQIAQLLQNLILNAIKFTDGRRHPEVEVSARPVQDGRWEIRVADNGVGIAPDQAQRIFEMFQRGTSRPLAHAAPGIGLALCARIVERHGGHIQRRAARGRRQRVRLRPAWCAGRPEPGAALRGASPGRVAARAARRGRAVRARPRPARRARRSPPPGRRPRRTTGRRSAAARPRARGARPAGPGRRARMLMTRKSRESPAGQPPGCR